MEGSKFGFYDQTSNTFIVLTDDQDFKKVLEMVMKEQKLKKEK